MSYYDLYTVTGVTYREEVVNFLYNFPQIYADWETVFLFLINSLYTIQLTWYDVGFLMGDIEY